MSVSYELTLGANQVVQILKKLKTDDTGATAVEYGLIIALIFLAMMGGVQAFGTSAISMWNNVSDRVEEARPK